MSSLSETLTYNVLERDEADSRFSSFSVSTPSLMDSGYILPPVEDISVNTKGIPTDISLNPTGGIYQWHLTDTWGINAHEVWNDYTGQGIQVAVFDDGFDYTHSDLAPNYRTDLDFDTAGSNDNDAINDSNDRHGTAVAAVIAADDNGTGLVGVAFDAEIIGIRRDFGETTFTSTVEGFEYALASGADVMNNSWGATTIFSDHPTRNYFGDDTTEVIDAMIDLVNLGRGGLGTSIVFSAGNSRGNDDNVNYHGYQNSPYNITVAGTDVNGQIYDSSTRGAAILTSAAGEGVVTADVSGSQGYVSGDVVVINGTSFSAPTVSGVVALILEANPNLGYRDVQEILAYSSRQLTDSSWQTNGNTHWNGSGMHFSHDYGYGLIDAFVAVRLAETWTEQKTYANLETVSVSGTPNEALLDNGTYQRTVTVTDDINIEHVVLELVVPHTRAGELTVTLISPDGTESILVETPGFGFHSTDVHGYTGLNFQFSSTAHWGETSAGDWIIRINDNSSGNTGSLESFDLQFLGSNIINDDTYYFTDEFQEVTLADSSGTDLLNFAAVRGDVTLVMTEGSSSSVVAGETLRISNTSIFENAILGDGNDTVTGNDVDNVISTGRGDDYIYTSLGNDTIDAQAGNDTIRFSGNLSDYTIDVIDAVTLRFTDNIGGFGVDVIQNAETFVFNDGSFTFVEIEDAVENPPSADPIVLRFDWDGNRSYYTSATVESTTLTAADLGITDASGALVGLDRDFTSLDIDILDPAAQDIEGMRISHNDALNLSVNGVKTLNVNLVSTTSSSVTVTNGMNGIISTGNGNDVISVQLAEIITPVSAENYQIFGNDGNDTITVSGTHNNMTVFAYGGTGNDDITVSVAGDHFLYGELGSDTINGGAGNDRIYGGDGDDIINGNNGVDMIFGGENNDVIHGNNGNDLLYGDAGGDVLYGDAGNDFIRGGTGVDSLHGGADDDVIYGDDGNDTVNGDAGNDILGGDSGDDIINGGDGNDVAYGGFGNDTINGGDGNDDLRGGANDDIINGGEGHDRINGNQGNDTLRGGAGNDRFYGEDGSDVIYGDAGSDSIFAGNGDDALYGGDGLDYLLGMGGADTFHFDMTSVDRVRDFQISEGDRLDVSDLLTGFTDGVDDVNDFVAINVRSSFRTDIYIDQNGDGSGYQQVGIIFGNLTGQTVDTLYANGDLLA